jgi:hypothetical protein
MNEIYFNWLDIGDKDISCGTQQNSDHIKDTNAHGQIFIKIIQLIPTKTK